MIELNLPIKTVSEANRREHWAAKRKRRVAQQAEVDAELLSALRRRKVALPCVVKLTRIGPRKLDDDNLRSAFKGIRDAIATRLGIDDGSEQIRFEYGQVPVGTHDYGVNIKIQSLGATNGKS